jgi:hypothetical protein
VSENAGARKDSVPLYGTAQTQLAGLRSWSGGRHVVDSCWSSEQFRTVVYGRDAGLLVDCPVDVQYASLLPWSQSGLPTSLWQYAMGSIIVG